MNERFERYNEITFDAYCKAAIDNAIHRGVRKKERRAEREPPLTELNDAVLFRLDPTDAPQEAVLEEAALGQALTYLPRRKREITLLYFFEDLTDAEIAAKLDMSVSAVQRQRNRAVCWLRDFLMEVP